MFGFSALKNRNWFLNSLNLQSIQSKRGDNMKYKIVWLMRWSQHVATGSIGSNKAQYLTLLVVTFKFLTKLFFNVFCSPPPRVDLTSLLFRGGGGVLTRLAGSCSSYSGLYEGSQALGRASQHCHHSSLNPPLKRNLIKCHLTKVTRNPLFIFNPLKKSDKSDS